MKSIFTPAALLLSITALAAPTPGTPRNFVACPIVRDTQTVPCWLAEYDGELYYLGVQSSAAAEWRPPLLGHRVLVEGIVSDAYRICGGIVLKPVHTSALPELDATCNSPVLPAEERYTVPFAVRGPGPAANAAKPLRDTSDAKKFVIAFDFDSSRVLGASAVELERALRRAESADVKRIDIVGRRAQTRLSDGLLLTEKSGIAERRAREIASLLIAAGVNADNLDIKSDDTLATANGISDFANRQVSIDIRTSP